jgi:hypothetical protein
VATVEVVVDESPVVVTDATEIVATEATRPTARIDATNIRRVRNFFLACSTTPSESLGLDGAVKMILSNVNCRAIEERSRMLPHWLLRTSRRY